MKTIGFLMALMCAGVLALAASGTMAQDISDEELLAAASPSLTSGVADVAEVEGVEGPEEGVEVPDAGLDVEDPSYTASITVPQDSGNLTEAQEAAQLQILATITAEAAQEAAQASVPGTVQGTPTLENENGNVVYEVNIQTGTTVSEVKVDAGTGEVLYIDTDTGADNEDEGGHED